ncbi:DUF6119 family protein [Nocardioides marmoraquaticus]
MRLNIFRIPTDQVAALREKLASSGLNVIKEVDQGSWHGDFFFSEHPVPSAIPWVQTFQSYFAEDLKPHNRNYFAVFLFVRGGDCFALSYGKSHFYVRPFCDYDFGIELAKRIANEEDIRQTASKRFAGSRLKDIKSYSSNTPLIIESGESVDYIQASVAESNQGDYGKTGKFGTSAQVAPKIAPPEIGAFLTMLVDELERPAKFPLPRTLIITEKDEIAQFDEMLLDELQSDIGTSDFTNNTIDLYGVDFVFPSEGTFVLRCGRGNKRQLEQLTMGDLKQYIQDCEIPREDILKIRITHEPEGGARYTESIKESIDFIADDDRVVLTSGKWMKFNQDYLKFLDDAIREIEVEEAEPQFAVINITEPEFNVSADVVAAGYELADKDFEIFKTRRPTPVEAWDLRKGGTVYAVKFGSAQKLHYACDQALNVLELLRNKAEAKEVPHFDRYCLWLGYRVKTMPDNLADTGSIILKQKIEAWARKAVELGVVPAIKLSQRVVSGLDSGPGGPADA